MSPGTPPLSSSHDLSSHVATREGKSSGPSARTRLLVSTVAGIVVGLLFGYLLSWRYGLLIGWMAAAGSYVAWMWATIRSMDAQSTAAHALREDPGRHAIDITVIIASVASLGAVALLLLGGSSGAATTDISAALCVGSVACSWTTLHTIFAGRYARLYYGRYEGGIDFNESDPPRYADFAYLAFTVGMTFQVSDTDLKTKEIRATALQHALLSFFLGAVILATTINLVAGLAK
ncbi:MAG: DUF1345 domain-containing protein [Acidimicrobiaceae bacterium]|nr:DUF1345 domain-containing protein [Acidimicrobiaceae bacterium]